MSERFLKFIILITATLITLSSCSKEDENEPTSGSLTNGKTSAVFNSEITYGTLIDQDGNLYKTVSIGTQVWMAENLRTTKYNDGTSIYKVNDPKDWENMKGVFCNSNYTNDADTITTFGRLYNWYTVKTGKLAPKGWHVPTDDDWKILTDYLGGAKDAGDKLKEAGTVHWASPNSAATNKTGFTALPGGFCDSYGYFGRIGEMGYWWSATEINDIYAWYRWMFYYNSDVVRQNSGEKEGYSVRLIKD